MRVLFIRPVTALWILGALPLAASAEEGTIDRTVPAEPQGEVLISNVSGSIDVRGWDRNEVKVTGDIGDDVERVDVSTTGGRTVIKVVVPHGGSNDSEATLEVQVPRMSSVEVSAVSADVSSRGVLGTQRIKTVSGEITADVAGDNSEVRSVSGDITLRLTSAGGYSTEIESFSGDITGCLATSVERVSKYGPGTQLMIRTVESGARVRAKTLSGDIEVCNK